MVATSSLSGEKIQWALVTAASLVITLSPLVVFRVFQRFFIQNAASAGMENEGHQTGFPRVATEVVGVSRRCHRMGPGVLPTGAMGPLLPDRLARSPCSREDGARDVSDTRQGRWPSGSRAYRS